MDKAINQKTTPQPAKTILSAQPCPHWPFTHSWAGCFFRTLNFDTAQASEADFEQLGLPLLDATQKRQAEFLAGRYCAVHALSELLGTAKAPQRHPETGLPIWPDTVCGSISHSHGWAASLVAHHQRWTSLGLDIERSISTARAQRLNKAIVTRSELELLAKLDGWTLAEFVTCAFSAKESLYKTLNPLTQSYFGFLDAELLSLEADGVFKVRLLKPLSPQWPAHKILHGQWAKFAHGFITAIGVPATSAN